MEEFEEYNSMIMHQLMKLYLKLCEQFNMDPNTEQMAKLKREIIANQSKDLYRSTLRTTNEGKSNRLMSVVERRKTLAKNIG